jgi:putative methionine-R-sulfoxide reductase with GAF domain
MDRSIRSLSDPIVGLPYGERRRCIRQKLHTPVYASFNGPQTGMVVDLSELLDLHEEGFAVQTSQRLEVNRPVTVCLDLPETKNYIHGSGQVVWSDDAGRGGIRFSGLPDRSRQILKEWLFSNLLIGCTNHTARIEQRARRKDDDEDRKSPEAAPVTSTPGTVPMSPGSAMLTAVEAVRLVVRDIGDNLDAILQLITERALSFTGANGAALAFLAHNDDRDDKMVCRARAGETAPPLGTPVDVSHGLTGECVRQGVLVSCADTANDSRVDPEVCRALGIGSLLAAPIISDLKVIGLVEVFSPLPHNFNSAHQTVLERLVELIPRNPSEKPSPEKTPPQAPNAPAAASDKSSSTSSTLASPSAEGASEAGPVPPTPEAIDHPTPEAHDLPPPQELEELAPGEAEPASEPANQTSGQLLYRALIGLAIVVVFVVIGYLLAPVIDNRWAISSQASQRQSGSPPSAQSAADPTLPVKYLSDLQRLAEQGDAEAEWQLGARYHSGEGVPPDDVQAMQWFQRAAEQGHVTAQATLGAYYWAGRGVPQDLTKAYFWSALALAQGDENSKARLEGLATQMTRDQIASARQQAEAWIHSHTDRAKSESN